MSLTLNIQYMSNYFLNGATGKVTKFDAHKPPEFKELKSNDFVQYGYDKEWKNRYPDYLLYLYNRSAKKQNSNFLPVIVIECKHFCNLNCYTATCNPSGINSMKHA